ncbi:hypothetical protein LWI29_014018 [Acer saccharum]|uniref:AP180 N-terminal homology (ANTH) domain-containing protein n=1 Tax=Acer saccharum TaxID=4024 RepID=A0AA39UI88_ACESA|nr:hypothetical protein LWI29_014018 [Acer saccharum]
MGTFQSFRKAYGALKDSTKVGLAKVNSEFKELDIAIVKATNHVECPPKERHVRTWDCSAWARTYALFLEERLECFRILKYDIESERLTKSSPGATKAENLADFYDYCKGLDLARNFQFPTLRQPPPSFLATMEEYIKEAPQAGSVGKRLEYHETELPPQKPEEPAESEKQEEKVEENEPVEETQDEPEPKEEEVVEAPQPLISTEDTGDLLGLNEVNPLAAELEQNNALALAIVQPGNDPLSSNRGLNEISGSGWELALVTTPSNITRPTVESKFGGGFDKLLLDSLYEDDNARRQIQMQNAGYGYGGMAVQNPFEQNDPFAMSSNIVPPTNVQMAMMAQQQQQQQFMMQQSNQQHNMMVPYQFPAQQSQFPQPQFPPQQQMQQMDYSNPFGDPYHAISKSSTTQQGNHMLL